VTGGLALVIVAALLALIRFYEESQKKAGSPGEQAVGE